MKEEQELWLAGFVTETSAWMSLRDISLRKKRIETVMVPRAEQFPSPPHAALVVALLLAALGVAVRRGGVSGAFWCIAAWILSKRAPWKEPQVATMQNIDQKTRE